MTCANGEYLSLNDTPEAPADVVEKLTIKSTGSSLDSLTRHFRNSIGSLKQLRPLQIFAILSLVLINVFSGSGQLLSLNMVVRAYLKGPANLNIPYTIVTLTSMLTALITLVMFVGYIIVKRPRLRFLLTCKNLYLSLGMGLTIALNGVMVVSATANVPEILQAFLLSTTIIWTFLFVKVMFGEKRSYFSPLVALSFVLSLGGVLVGSASKFSTSGMSTDTVYWTLFFAAGLIPGALNGVVSAKYMRSFTLTDEQLALVENRVSKRTLAENDYLLARGPSNGNASPIYGSDVPQLIGTDANTAKFACLTLGSVSQVVCMFALLPTSAIPWMFQSSPSLAALGEGLLSGYECTFNQAPGCSDATIYFMIFLACFIGNAVSSMWLNYYSPAVCAIIGELNAPIAAVALIAIPALNVNHKAYNVGEAIGAVVLITLGSTIYTIWEESTRHTGGGEEVIRSSRRFQTNPIEGEIAPTQTV